MTRDRLITIGLSVAVASLLFAASGSRSTPSAVQHEYGVLQTAGPLLSWISPHDSIYEQDARGLARYFHVEQCRRIELEIRILNALAARGWEIAGTPEPGLYVLRRAH